jgi:glucose-6-phosphate isomerase
VAVTASPDKAVAFGIAPANVLPFWDWVGGRYSVWSAVGLAVAIAVGWEPFVAFLDGAASIDRHFREAPTPRNLPVLLALSTVWNANFLDLPQIVLAPYSQALARFPAYVQQLSLESNGKSVTREGIPVSGHTAPSFWGEPGTNAQHAFFQWLHQGTRTVPVEFIVPVVSGDDPARQRLLVANALAQAQALMLGRSEASVREELAASGLSLDEAARQAPHRTFPGDRPSTTLLLPRVDPRCVGQLIALFEHRTFVEALIWGINPFDQFGVELGKRLTPPIASALESGTVPASFDGSTRGLIERSREMSGRDGQLPPAPPRPRG